MKKSHLVVTGAVVLALALVVFFASRRNPNMTGATGPMEGRALSRPPGTLPHAESQTRPTTTQLTPPIDSKGPITATAQIVRSDNSVIEAESLDGEFARILVEPKEVLTIRLALNGLDPNRDVRIDADNGGSLNRKLGPLTLPPTPGEDAVQFHYALGPHRGKYTLYVRQGQRREFMEFWVGPEPPRGRPGPLREFNPDKI